MAGIRLELTGDEEALSRLEGASEALDYARPMWDEVGLSLTTSTERRFTDTQAGPDGNPWPPSIRALAEGGRTLIDTARLMQSISYEASESGVAVGTNTLYAAIHQLGGTITAKSSGGLRFKVGDQWVTKKSVTIPARPFLGLDDDDEQELIAIAGDWLGRKTGATPEASP